jgi:hypothetical protein
LTRAAVPTAAYYGDRDSARSPTSPAALEHTAPDAIRSALLAQGITSNVYGFDSGGEPQLMIQYDSPIRNRPGYDEMLEKVKQVAAQHFLQIDPPLYTLWLAATDVTGTSDTVLRLDRYAVERWLKARLRRRFLNNGFVPARIASPAMPAAAPGKRPT